MSINVGIILSALLLVTFISLVATGSLQSVWFETGDTVFFNRQNPYTFDIGIHGETGFKNLNVVINSMSFSQLQCDSSPWTAYAILTPTDAICRANPSIHMTSAGGIDNCCRANGWAGINGGCNGVCFKYVSNMPSWIKLKYGSEVVWETTGVLVTPITIDLAPYVERSCAEALRNMQSSERGALELECITRFQFENSNSVGSMGISFGSISGRVSTCFDRIQNQDEISIDYGGVCGTDLCSLRDVKCDMRCEGVTKLTGSCISSTGICSWERHNNSVDCGFIAEPIIETIKEETPIANISEPEITEPVIEQPQPPSDKIIEEPTKENVTIFGNIINRLMEIVKPELRYSCKVGELEQQPDGSYKCVVLGLSEFNPSEPDIESGVTKLKEFARENTTVIVSILSGIILLLLGVKYYLYKRNNE